ncbi:hypothetical protein GUJ93_ZPchr0001g30730 [Zizania palustris]|uniref:Uncharacterized protein n=1 Tax=Zizania palustris TaxID=103762 RepID=A0A8J5R6T2_ZIZPA|nr:hypothetical protein GUJ93_ZPchr0001g30730 [Zizania palustris]
MPRCAAKNLTVGPTRVAQCQKLPWRTCLLASAVTRRPACVPKCFPALGPASGYRALLLHISVAYCRKNTNRSTTAAAMKNSANSVGKKQTVVGPPPITAMASAVA